MPIRMAPWLEEEHKRVRPLLDTINDQARTLVLQTHTADELLQLAAHIEHLAEECRKLTPRSK